jgi:hypothetical protein
MKLFQEKKEKPLMSLDELSTFMKFSVSKTDGSATIPGKYQYHCDGITILYYLWIDRKSWKEITADIDSVLPYVKLHDSNDNFWVRLEIAQEQMCQQESISVQIEQVSFQYRLLYGLI